MAAPGPFPLLVEGSWGLDPPKKLGAKLQVYFQSQKRSGGGECKVYSDPENPAGFLVLFFQEDVRQNVLEKENHELVWPGRGTFNLFVWLPPDHDEAPVYVEKISTKEFKTKDVQKPGFYGTVSSPAFGVHEVTIGPIRLQVATGDITDEVADVFVNSTSNTFNLKSGVSKAILEAAGRNVEVECYLKAQQNKNEYIITEGGFLNCKIIIHVDGGNDVKKSVSCILQECEQQNYSSICLPAIGTGNAQQNPDTVAKAIMDAIEEFVQKKSVQSVRKVKVVIFQPHILDIFYNNMKEREGCPASPQPSMISKIVSEIPAHWTDMKQQDLLVVRLHTSDPEYITVASKFNQTCSNFVIEKIERIQNPRLWNSYQVSKKNMDIKNSNKMNEAQLFHGTDAGSVPHVNSNGFNRSYAGKNAVSYGKGSYFAVNASYSANNTYSKPDASGRKHMYYVRVLTGNYTTGNPTLIVPPSRDPQNPTDLYDTVVDNDQNPSIFVVFYDYQTYPEYLITFRW